jgi:hypothetical protein
MARMAAMPVGERDRDNEKGPVDAGLSVLVGRSRLSLAMFGTSRVRTRDIRFIGTRPVRLNTPSGRAPKFPLSRDGRPVCPFLGRRTTRTGAWPPASSDFNLE